MFDVERVPALMDASHMNVLCTAAPFTAFCSEGRPERRSASSTSPAASREVREGKAVLAAPPLIHKSKKPRAAERCEAKESGAPERATA